MATQPDLQPKPPWYFNRTLELEEIARVVGDTQLSSASHIEMSLSGLIVERHHDSIRAWYPKASWSDERARSDFRRLTEFCGKGSSPASPTPRCWVYTWNPVLRRCMRCGGWENGPDAGHTNHNGCPTLPRARP
jgi:hypothetical protein